jgi:hypothetical protein
LWLLLLVFALVSLYRTRPFQGDSINALSDTMQWISALVIGLGLIYLVYRVVARSSIRTALRIGFLTLVTLLAFWTVSVTWRANYINFAKANEMLFYAHGSQDIKLALAEIEEISQRTVGDKQIKVAYDDESTWPLEWYMRQYPNAVFYGANPTREALDAPVVIVGSGNDAKAKPYLGDKYYRRNYRLVWWPAEDYKSLTAQLCLVRAQGRGGADVGSGRGADRRLSGGLRRTLRQGQAGDVGPAAVRQPGRCIGAVHQSSRCGR